MKSMTLEHKQDQLQQDQRPKRPYRPRKIKTTLDEHMEALPVKTRGISVFETSSQVDTLSPEKRRAILRDNSTI